MSETYADRTPDSTAPRSWTRWADAAVDAKNWELALQRWSRCISQFGGTPLWRAKLGDILVNLGRLEEAKAEFESVAREMPELPLGLVRLAAIAMRQGDWKKAQSLWAECIKNYPQGTVKEWKLARAKSLQKLRPRTEASAAARRLKRFAQLDEAVHAARRTGDDGTSRDALLGEIQQIFLHSMSDQNLVKGIYWSIALGGDEIAAELLEKCVEQTEAPQILERCFYAVPRCVEQGGRGVFWDRILTKLRSPHDEASPPTPDAIELELCVLLAMERFPDFVRIFDSRHQQFEGGVNFRRLSRIRERLAKPCDLVFAERKVFGIGLSRTATSSLNDALNILGIDAVHWANPLTGQIISEIDAFLFGGCTDTPVSSDFERLYYTYPNALFIWTQRPKGSWIGSFQGYKSGTIWGRDAEQRQALELAGGSRKFRLNQIHQGLYWNASSLEKAYRAFGKRARAFFADKPKSKLLELNVFGGHGWTEVCAFLDAPIPDSPFPWANRGD